MLTSGTWCHSVGHYLFNKKRFPEGKKSLRQWSTSFMKQALSWECIALLQNFKDRPLRHACSGREVWTDKTSVLAENLSMNATEIHCSESLREWAGSPVSRQKVWEGGVLKHQEVIIDKEIIQYESIGPEGQYDTSSAVNAAHGAQSQLNIPQEHRHAITG